MELENIRVRVDDDDDLSLAKSAAVAAEVEVEVEKKAERPPGDIQPEFFEPFSWILIGGAVLAVGKFVYDWWQGPHKGGLVIDRRPEAKDDLYRDKDVPFGWVIIYLADGKVTIETKDAPKDAWERLLGEIVSGAAGTVKAIAEAAAKTEGVTKVTPEPVPAPAP